jgi:hypothetical protein
MAEKNKVNLILEGIYLKTIVTLNVNPVHVIIYLYDISI